MRVVVTRIRLWYSLRWVIPSWHLCTLPLLLLASSRRRARLRTLRTIQAATLTALVDACCVERATHDVITHTGQVFHTTTANKHYGVLLQRVPLTRNIRGDLNTIAEAHTGNLPKRGVRLLGGHGTNLSTNATLLGRTLRLTYTPL